MKRFKIVIVSCAILISVIFMLGYKYGKNDISLEEGKKLISIYGIECNGLDVDFGDIKLSDKELAKLETIFTKYNINCKNGELMFPGDL